MEIEKIVRRRTKKPDRVTLSVNINPPELGILFRNMCKDEGLVISDVMSELVRQLMVKRGKYKK